MERKPSTGHVKMKMKTLLVFSLILMSCCPCRTQKKDILLQAPYVESGEDTAETEGGEEERIFHDIWAELRKLRDMSVEQKVELRHLLARVTAAESLVEALQKENRAQSTELAVAQQMLSTLQQRLTDSERHIEELEKQQEGQKAIVQEVQDTNRVRKLAFSASLLASGEGNTSSEEFVPLIYRNVFTNTGNHYNSNTGYFTAPVRGVYYFRFTGHLADTDRGTRMRIVKNGHAMVFTGDRLTTSADAEDSISNGVVLQLEVGDVVSVQISGDVWDDQYHRTTFSGFLLFPL
ncbi:heavy metal-binding protein HIP-like isoform X2 [Seriola dumerili]|uniref:heavy metal-binding protein HIP-like isoform X2 n=1 Tax=Seriola dumerili TaxID=41447 RepID=UPI000BBED48F|nr:heavy metal-binding protein HIP-like isoform X2 [Seriola dumerili]